MQYITYLVTALSIAGTVANSFQKRWCFIVWGCTNTFWTIYNAATEQYAQAILYTFNFVMAVIGFVKWKKKEKGSENMPNHEQCPLYPYCITQKGEHETCDDMVRKYNAGLLLPPEYMEFQEKNSID